MVRKCIVCKNKNHLFKFPSNEIVRGKWINALNDYIDTSNLHNSAVCKRHFADSCFSTSTNRFRLLPESSPTLLIPKQETPDVTMEADYSLDLKDEMHLSDDSDDYVNYDEDDSFEETPSIEHDSPVITSSSSMLDDEFHSFGINVAAQLRRMPLKAALQTQVKLMSVLAEARM